MSTLRRWADEHQFVAEEIRGNRDDDGNILPSVTLLWMNPDPLGALAAACRMYEGKATYALDSVTDEERMHYFNQAQATHLKAPLEFIKMHFFIEGVTRSFTHQMVRQRTAVYSQESMRFAVKENMADEISVPPSIALLPKHSPTRQMWDEAVDKISETYNYLVANGIPAEDARGLAPHATTTRLNFATDLRNLVEHAGNRLCTQAQFEWRIVFMEIVNAISKFADHPSVQEKDKWQFDTLAKSSLFRPICYSLGKCPFQASFDRSCTIRDRADAGKFDEIAVTEWLADPAAARLTSGGGGHD